MSRATLEIVEVEHASGHACRSHGRNPDLAVWAHDENRIHATLAEAQLLILLPLLLRHLDMVTEEHDEAAEDGYCSCNVCQPVAALHFTVEALYAQLDPLLETQEKTLRIAKGQLVERERQRRTAVQAMKEEVAQAEECRQRKEAEEQQTEVAIGWHLNLPSEDAAVSHAEDLEESLLQVVANHDARLNGHCGCLVCQHANGFAFQAELMADALNAILDSPGPRKRAEMEAMFQRDADVARQEMRAEQDANTVAVSVVAV